MKIKLFTHTDLDGIGNALLLLKYNKISMKDIDYLDYTNVNDVIRQFIKDKKYKEYDIVYITDLSINEELAEMINNIKNNNFILFDHHQSSLPLNKYKWATVQVCQDNGIKTCATTLFYNGVFDTFEDDVLVETIRQWDTFDWVNKEEGYRAQKLNDLLYILGREDFIELCMKSKFDIVTIINNDNSKLLLKIDERNKKEYIENKSKTGVFMKLSIPINKIKREYNVYLVCADKYISELGNSICKNNKNYDLCIMIDIDKKSLSYRSVKEDVDCCEIAKYFNGGGHLRSAGSEFTYISNESIYSSLFDVIMKLYSGNYAIIKDYFNLI